MPTYDHDHGRGEAPHGGGAPHRAARREQDPRAVSVDDLWLHEWAADGIAALEALLAAHAAFTEYLRTRGADDGDDADA